MGLFRRLKRLWDISRYDVKENGTGNPWLEKPKRLATIVEDDPLEVFPSDDEQDSTSEQSPADRAD